MAFVKPDLYSSPDMYFIILEFKKKADLDNTASRM